MYHIIDRSVKQRRRGWRIPFLVLRWEPELSEMPDDACHGHGAVAPWWTKVEIELVILYIWAASDASLQTRELENTTTNKIHQP